GGPGGGRQRQRSSGHRQRRARRDGEDRCRAVQAASSRAHGPHTRAGARAVGPLRRLRIVHRFVEITRDMIRIHNSLTGEKETLQPIKPGHIGMYVCGMTVYDYIHVGHAWMLTVFDMVQRYLRHRGYNVTYVRNITDVDDKIIKRAAERGESIEQFTETFIKAQNEDFAALALQTPDVEPRATQHIGHMISMIETLIERGYAYVAP